jgi:hypothetical protein
MALMPAVKKMPGPLWSLRQLEGGDVLPGFKLKLDKLFAERGKRG